MGALDTTGFTTTQVNTLAPGATASRDDQGTVAVGAGNHQGVAFPIAGASFPVGVPVSVTFALRGTGGEALRAYFGYMPAAPSGTTVANFVLTDEWQEFTLEWTPTVERPSAMLSVRSEGAVAYTFSVAPATVIPPPPPPPPDLQTQIDELRALLHGGKPNQVFATGLSGPEWAPLTAPGVDIAPPPPPPPPASGGVSYDNAVLFADTSWWRNPVPADPPQYPDPVAAEAWRQNLLSQLQLQDGTGPFGVPVGPVDPRLTGFNVAGNNFMVYVVDEFELPVRVGNRHVLGTPPTGPAWGPWLLESHNKLMQGVPVPPGAHADAVAGDHSIIILQVDASGTPKTLWDLISFRPIGDPVVAASIEADGKPYEGTPQGYFDGKRIEYTVSSGSRMDNVDQHNGAFKNIVDAVTGARIERAEEGASATSIPYLAGLITWDECKAVVDGTAEDFGHTLKMHLKNAAPFAVPPAQRHDGTATADWVPEGTRWYLSAGPEPWNTAPMTDFSPYDGEVLLVQALVRTLARFGIMGTDKTGLGFDGPLWRNPNTVPGFVGDGQTPPYDEAFYPAFFGPAGGWSSTAVLQRIPWQNMKCLDPSVSPA